MSLIYVDEDPWVREYEALETACRDVATRQAENNSTATHAADIRLRLRQCTAQLQRLRATLNIEHPDIAITPEERERRERGIEGLQTRIHKLSQYSSARAGNVTFAESESETKQRDLLFGGDTSAKATTTGNVNTIKSTSEILQEQDRGLDALATVLSRQRAIAEGISSEVDTQNEILDDLGEQITGTAATTEQATKKTASISFKDKTCGYWMIIIGLFVAIIVVAVV